MEPILLFPSAKGGAVGATACQTVHRADVRNEPLAIFGQPAHELCRCRGTRVVLQAPADEFDHRGQEIKSLLGRFVDDAPGLGGIAASGDHFGAFEQLQPAREYV